MSGKQKVLDALCATADSVKDGKLVLEGVRVSEGVEVWDVKHAPTGANPITEMMMGGFRRGTVKVFEAPAGPVYQMEIYGGEQAITEQDGKWREAPLRREEMKFSAATVNAIADRIRQDAPDSLILGVSSLSERSVVVEMIDGITREERKAIVALTPDGSRVDSVKFLDDPEGLGL